MKRLFFLFLLVIGLNFVLTSKIFVLSVVVPCDSSKNTCSPGDTASCRCGGYLQCSGPSPIGGEACYTWQGTCTACAQPVPPTTQVCTNCYDGCGIGSYSACTYVNQTCSGGNCNLVSTTSYADGCGISFISGTAMCPSSTNNYNPSQYSITCSPPAPDVTLSPVCASDGDAQIRVNYVPNSGSYGNRNYDLRYRWYNSSTDHGSWRNVCSPPSSGTGYDYVIKGLSDSTRYQVQVREHTDAGRNGPTNFGSATATTRNCGGPDLDITAFTFNSGYAGANSTATVTVRNIGTETASNFVVRVEDSATPELVYTRTVTSLAAGASTTLTYNVTLNSTAGTYTALATADSTSVVTELSESNNTATDAYTITANNLTVNVFQDLNANGVDDGGAELGYAGARVTVTGQGAGTYTTNASGQVVVSNLLPGSSTVTLTVPTGFTATTANPRSTTFPPSQTINFGIQPAAPTCSGGLTASPVTVNPGQVSTLTANGCTTPAQGATLTYSWLTPAPGAITSTNPSTTPTSTWRAPTPYWTDIYAYPTVNVCQTGTSLCRPYAISNGVGVGNQGIHIIPLFSATGNVFVDQNKDSLQNGTDTNYTGGISINPNPAGVTVTYPSAGNYQINNMPGGTYTISYTSLPAGYAMTYPKNGPPPSFTVTVGNASTGGTCSVAGHNSAACDVNGNITALRYGITNSIPWIQSTGGDITGNQVTDPSGGGISNPIPPGASCGTYVSLTGAGGTPGVIYAGAGSYNFGSGQASPNPYNWVIGGLSYPDTYIPSTPGVIKTAYAYRLSLATQSGLTPVDIAGYCGAGGISNCTLSTSIPNGLYISNGNLTLNGASYTFPSNKNFVILVNGDLNINTEVHIPVGSTAFFTVSRDINVGANVGEAVVTSTRANVEGYYSADRNFNVLGLNSCPTTDRRLNVAGSIVVNASLAGGTFVNQRDLCAGNYQCPAFMVIERPDFVLNSPEFLKSARRVWREIAP
jgi:hypothetical protein